MTPEEAAERDAIALALDTLMALVQAFEQRGPLLQGGAATTDTRTHPRQDQTER